MNYLRYLYSFTSHNLMAHFVLNSSDFKQEKKSRIFKSTQFVSRLGFENLWAFRINMILYVISIIIKQHIAFQNLPYFLKSTLYMDRFTFIFVLPKEHNYICSFSQVSCCFIYVKIYFLILVFMDIVKIILLENSESVLRHKCPFDYCVRFLF